MENKNLKLHVTTEQGEKVELEVQEGITLMEALRDYEDGVAAQCGGDLRCATCHVYVAIPDPSPEEVELLDGLEYRRPTSRLACQIRLEREHDGLQVSIAPFED